MILLVNICVGKVKKCYFGVAKIIDGEKTFTYEPLSQSCEVGKNFGCYQASASDDTVYTFGCASRSECEQLGKKLIVIILIKEE